MLVVFSIRLVVNQYGAGIAAIMIQIRKTRIEDLKSILELIQELATYEEMPHGPKLTVDDLIRDGGFSPSSSSSSPSSKLFHSFVAEVEVQNEENIKANEDHQPLTR